MNVSAAAVNNVDATPKRRCALETKRRGIPRGVGSGVGISRMAEEPFELEVDSEPSRGAIAMAVEIRCAMTQPIIFSRCELPLDDGEESRNK